MNMTEFLVSRIGTVVDGKFLSDLSALLASGNTGPVDLAQFGSESVGEYVLTALRFSEAKDQLHEIHKMHWHETEVHSHGIEFNPDYDLYQQLDESGKLIVFVVMHEGKIVGDCMMKLNTSMHTQRLTASEDCLFLHKEHRGKGVALKFVKYIEGCLKKLGVTEIRVSSKLINHADKFMIRAGFKPIATQLIKMLE